MTYARLTTMQGDPSKLEDGIEAFRKILPQVRQQQGFEAARFLVDRNSGKVQIVTLWESEAAALASADTVQQWRAEVAQRLGATNPTVELLELVVNESA